MIGGTVDEALALLRAGVDGVLKADLSALSSTELTSLLRELEAQQRRLAAVDVTVVAEIEDRRLAGDYARSTTAELLVELLRVSPGEAKARVVRAGDLGPRRELTGAPLPPLLPVASAALQAGEISGAHVAVITRCVQHLPAAIAHEAAPVAESMLVQAARHEHPAALARTAALLMARLDPDGREPDDLGEQRRHFTLLKDPGGFARARGWLTPELTALLEALFDSLGAPVPGADGLPDERSPGQRRHDALVDAGKRLMRSATLPAAGGAPTTVLLRTTLEEYESRRGAAQTAHGDVWPMSRLLLSACDAEIVPVVFNEAGATLFLGRTQRLASRSQRLALAARDGGCCFPGCDRPPAWCEAHHVRAWLDYGPTDIDNLCLLCRFHHREFEGRGWAVEMCDGVPQWIPPPFIDPQRRPIRNTAQHLSDFEFNYEAA